MNDPALQGPLWAKPPIQAKRGGWPLSTLSGSSCLRSAASGFGPNTDLRPLKWKVDGVPCVDGPSGARGAVANAHRDCVYECNRKNRIESPLILKPE